MQEACATHYTPLYLCAKPNKACVANLVCMLQLVKRLMEKRKEPRTALMLPAIVYAHLAVLDIANTKGKTNKDFQKHPKTLLVIIITILFQGCVPKIAVSKLL